MPKPVNIDWSKQPIGKISDADLAEKIGVSQRTVSRYRNRLGITSFRQSSKTKSEAESRAEARAIDWDAQPLGEVPDRQLARKLGVGYAVVRGRRTERKIPICKTVRHMKRKGIDWDSQPLGKKGDQEIADGLGCSSVSVCTARKRRGIPAFKSYTDWDQEPLGKVTDKLLAIMLDVNIASVRSARESRGIRELRTKPKTQWVD